MAKTYISENPCTACGSRIRYQNCGNCKACSKSYNQKRNSSDVAKQTKKKRDLWNRYGLTLDEFDALKMAQNNCCAICLDEFTKTPNVDHNHKTGQNRGLLCIRCNRGIGVLKESPAILRNAANYIEKYEYF